MSLANAGISTVEQLCGLSARDLLKIEHFGATTLDEVRNALAQRGLNLRDE